MRISTSWYRTALAALMLLAACAPGDRTIGPDAARSTGTPSQPAGAPGDGTILLQESFEDNAFAARGWYDNTNMATTTAQHLPGGTRALEAHFLPGARTPTWGGAARRLFPASPTLHVSYWVKYSSNWVGSGRAYHPHEFLVLSDQDGAFDGPSNNWLTVYLEHKYQNGGIPRLALQDSKAINTSFGTPPLNLVGVTENRSTGGCNGIVEAAVTTSCFSFPPWYNAKEVIASGVQFQPNPGPGYKGDWNHVEVYFQLNSVVGGIGQPDGVMQYWFNGALVIDRRDILFRTGARPNIQFRQFLISPYIGDGSPVDQYMWVDDLTVATGKVVGGPAGSVASVTVTPGTVSQGAGATQQLIATLRDAGGNVLTGPTVAWTSSNSAVATVNGSGLETGVAPGTATVTATSEGRSGTAAIAVTTAKPGTVTGLSVAAVTNGSVTLSFTEVNSGTGLPASYDIRSAVGTISWGSATAVTQGSCRVPVAGTAIGATRTCTVLGLAPSTSYQFQLIAFRGTLNLNAVFGSLSNVVSAATAAAPAAPVASVTLSPASMSLSVGATQQLTATLRDASGNILSGRAVTWASSSPAVATVGANGLVTGVLAGTATVTATSEGQSGTAAATITEVPVAAVAVSPASASLLVGGAQQLTATLRDASGNVLTGRSVTWASGSPAVATVSASGLVTALAAGTATITATSGGINGVATVTITSMPVASVTVSPAITSLLVGAAQQLTATLRDASGNVLAGRSITWVSSGPAVATVGSSGLVTGVAAGTATVTATSEGKSGTATATVTATATKPGTVANLAVAGATSTSVTLSFTEVHNGTGQPASYDIRSAVGTISWGSATAVTQGSCRVPVAGTAIGATRTCTVLGLAPSTSYQFQLIAFRGTLNLNAVFGALSGVVSATTVAGPQVPVASVSLSPGSANVGVGQAVQLTATPRDASGNALSGRVITWATSGTAASVSGSGLVTGLVAGAATITATSEGQNGTANVTVTAAPPPPPPPSGGAWPNEPSGFTMLTDNAWNVKVGGGWQSTGGSARIMADGAALQSPSNVLEFPFPIGFSSSGVGPDNLWYNIGSSRPTELYVGFWFKASNPWQGHASGFNKIMFITTGGTQEAVILEITGGVNGPFQTAAVCELAPTVNRYENRNTGPFTLGVWHRIEVYLNYNGGILRWWVDGVLKGDYSGVPYGYNGFDGFKFQPTWGGVGGPAKQTNDYFRVDHVRASRR